jgi:hypothetical protein
LVDAVGELGVAVEAVDQEDTAVLVEGAGDPDRQGDGEAEVKAVAEDGFVHGGGYVFFKTFSKNRK